MTCSVPSHYKYVHVYKLLFPVIIVEVWYPRHLFISFSVAGIVQMASKVHIIHTKFIYILCILCLLLLEKDNWKLVSQPVFIDSYWPVGCYCAWLLLDWSNGNLLFRLVPKWLGTSLGGWMGYNTLIWHHCFTNWYIDKSIEDQQPYNHKLIIII